jgi:hypothetical protein
MIFGQQLQDGRQRSLCSASGRLEIPRPPGKGRKFPLLDIYNLALDQLCPGPEDDLGNLDVSGTGLLAGTTSETPG